MGFRKYHNVGVSAPPAIRPRVKEVMYCLFPGGEDGNDGWIQDDFRPDMMMSAEGALVDADKLYLLLKKLFGSLHVFEESGMPRGTVKPSVAEALCKAAAKKGYQELLALISEKLG